MSIAQITLDTQWKSLFIPGTEHTWSDLPAPCAAWSVTAQRPVLERIPAVREAAALYCHKFQGKSKKSFFICENRGIL